MTCEDAHFHMHDYISGELAPEHHEPLMNHLEECGSCRALFNQTQLLQTAVRDYMQYETPPELQTAVSRILLDI